MVLQQVIFYLIKPKLNKIDILQHNFAGGPLHAGKKGWKFLICCCSLSNVQFKFMVKGKRTKRN